jgi:hypothetical protein
VPDERRKKNGIDDKHNKVIIATQICIDAVRKQKIDALTTRLQQTKEYRLLHHQQSIVKPAPIIEISSLLSGETPRRLVLLVLHANNNHHR